MTELNAIIGVRTNLLHTHAQEGGWPREGGESSGEAIVMGAKNSFFCPPLLFLFLFLCPCFCLDEPDRERIETRFSLSHRRTVGGKGRNLRSDRTMRDAHHEIWYRKARIVPCPQPLFVTAEIPAAPVMECFKNKERTIRPPRPFLRKELSPCYAGCCLAERGVATSFLTPTCGLFCARAYGASLF